jgi:hypothetical protein
MLVHVRTQDPTLLGAVQRHLEKRVRAALGASATHVASVTLGLSDINGPRGGADLRCVVTVELVPSGSLRAEATHADLLSAVGRALARARRAIQDGAKRERGERVSRRVPRSGAAEAAATGQSGLRVRASDAPVGSARSRP